MRRSPSFILFQPLRLSAALLLPLVHSIITIIIAFMKINKNWIGKCIQFADKASSNRCKEKMLSITNTVSVHIRARRTQWYARARTDAYNIGFPSTFMHSYVKWTKQITEDAVAPLKCEPISVRLRTMCFGSHACSNGALSNQSLANSNCLWNSWTCLVARVLSPFFWR